MRIPPLLAYGLLTLVSTACAQSFPTKPIRIIVPFPPGGGTDNLARVLAVTGDKRLAALPTVPTFNESGIAGVDAGTYWNALAPAGTPRDIINLLNSVMVKTLQAPDVHKRLQTMGIEPIASTPDEAAHAIRDNVLKWAKAVKEAGIHTQ